MKYTNDGEFEDPVAIRDLIQRIADGSVSVAEWNGFTLKRCSDKRLEKIRRRIVDCAMTSGQCSSRPASDELRALAASMVEQWDWWCPDSDQSRRL